jgi:hypothetical protein
MQGDKAEQNHPGGFVKNNKRRGRKTIAEYSRYGLIKKKHRQDWIHNFEQFISFHNNPHRIQSFISLLMVRHNTSIIIVLNLP